MEGSSAARLAQRRHNNWSRAGSDGATEAGAESDKATEAEAEGETLRAWEETDGGRDIARKDAEKI